jgi:predicted nucleic acid-binding protein
MPALLQRTAIVLDETPLSLLAQKVGHAQGDVCKSWYAALIHAGHRFYVPEIADFELRRELIRAGKTASVGRLDAFISAVPDRYLPLTTPAVRLAAALWAQARNQGRTTAPPEALDGDTLIAAQAILFNPAAFGLSATLVATANIGHLGTLTTAASWSMITP